MAFENNPLGITNLKDAQEAATREDADNVQRNIDFYFGDHWQGGNAWSGPFPSTDDQDSESVKAEIERGFKSKNVIKETVDRAADGVTGKTPLWEIVPKRKVTEAAPITEEEQALINEAKELLGTWMDEKEFHKYLSKCMRQTLLAGKSTMRLFVPLGFLQGGEMLISTDEPVKNLYLDAPSPLAATVLTDDNSREQEGIFLGSIGDTDTAELQYLLPLANEKGQRISEITVIVGDSNAPTVQSVTLDLGGRLLMFEIEMPRLTTEQVVSLQQGINLNLTMMERNSVLGGFLERVILNGQLPAHYEEQDDGSKVLVRDPFIVGAGSVNNIQGTPIVDENTGNIKGYTPANIIYKDPQSPATYISAADTMYQMILQECKQLHAVVLGSGASGDAQRAAVAQFFSYLKTPKDQIDKAGKWCLETVLAFASFVEGEAGKFNDFKVNFETRLDTGAISTAEVDIIERYVRVGILSLETARERVGVEDPDLEARRVMAEKEARGGQDVLTFTGNNAVQSSITGQKVENVDNIDRTNNQG